jgi:hypothetical protein
LGEKGHVNGDQTCQSGGQKFKRKRRMNMTTKTAKPIQKSKKLASVKPLTRPITKKMTLRKTLKQVF